MVLETDKSALTEFTQMKWTRYAYLVIRSRWLKAFWTDLGSTVEHSFYIFTSKFKQLK